MASSHFDDLIAIGHLWRPGKLPSELLTYYAPDVTRRWHITPADWYAFDLAATVRWAEMQHERQREGQHEESKPPAPNRRSASTQSSAIQEQGDRLAIRGSEIPPWDARYRPAPGRSPSR